MSTTVTITLVGYCSSQGHVTVDVTPQGATTRRLTYEVSELREPLGWDEAKRIMLDILRMRFRGMTINQARADLQAGITVTI